MSTEKNSINPTQQGYAIEVSGLRKSFGKNEVLKGVDFKVARGSIFALLGPNGAGKTTTVRIMSTLLGHDSGSVIINGLDVKKQAAEVRKIIGLTGQSAAVDELLTGRENLVMMGRLYRLTPASAVQRAEELLKEFALMKAADRKVSTYSGGMRRRLDLAVSLIATPPIIFLDEPTTGLDPRSRLAMWKIIRELTAAGTTILLTTQYLEEADQLADQIVVIDQGKVIAEGTAKELKSKVGKDRLELSFVDVKSLQQAQKLFGDRVADINERELTLSLVIQDIDVDVKEVLISLSAAEVHLSSLDVRKPTLDDVFLSLTGKNKNG
jgi:ABC-2 type transport system ATP-binding protein